MTGLPPFWRRLSGWAAARSVLPSRPDGAHEDGGAGGVGSALARARAEQQSTNPAGAARADHDEFSVARGVDQSLRWIAGEGLHRHGGRLLVAEGVGRLGSRVFSGLTSLGDPLVGVGHAQRAAGPRAGLRG